MRWESVSMGELWVVWLSLSLSPGRGRDWWGESRMRLRRGDLITIRTIRLCSPHLSPVNIISHAPSLVSSCPSLHLIMNFSWKFWKEDWSLWSWWLISMKKNWAGHPPPLSLLTTFIHPSATCCSTAWMTDWLSREFWSFWSHLEYSQLWRTERRCFSEGSESLTWDLIA